MCIYMYIYMCIYIYICIVRRASFSVYRNMAGAAIEDVQESNFSVLSCLEPDLPLDTPLSPPVLSSGPPPSCCITLSMHQVDVLKLMTYGFSKLMTYGFSNLVTYSFSKLMTYGFLKLMTYGFLKPDHPSNRGSVRPTVHPVLRRRTTNIVLSATTSTLFTATTKEPTKDVARRKALPPPLWWRPKTG